MSEEAAPPGDTTTPDNSAGSTDAVAKQFEELKSFFTSQLEAMKPKPPSQEEVDKAKANEDMTVKVARLEKERDEANTKATKAVQTAFLTHAGLKHPRLATQVLSEYDGKLPFEEYVNKAKTEDPVLKDLFNQPIAVTKPEKEAPPNGPASGSSGARTGNSKAAEQALKELAERQWPGNQALQERFIVNRMALEKN
jgi:hypothetical protein